MTLEQIVENYIANKRALAKSKDEEAQQMRIKVDWLQEESFNLRSEMDKLEATIRNNAPNPQQAIAK